MCEQNQEQNRRGENAKNFFKIYDIFQNIVIQETKEFYSFSEIILGILIAILAAQHWLEDEQILLLVLGSVLSVIWFVGFIIQIMWKRHWQGRIRNVEDEISKKEPKLSKILTKDREDLKPGLWYKDDGHIKIPFVELHFTFIFGLFPIVFILVFTYKLMLSVLYLNLIGYLYCFKLDYLIIILLLVFLISILLYVSYGYPPFRKLWTPRIKK